MLSNLICTCDAQEPAATPPAEAWPCVNFAATDGQTQMAAAALTHVPLREGLELIIQDFRPTGEMTLRFSREASALHFGYMLKGRVHTVIDQGRRRFFNSPNLAGRGGVLFLPHTISQGHYQAGDHILGLSVDVSPRLFGQLAEDISPALPDQLRDLVKGARSSNGFVLPATITAPMNAVLRDILAIRRDSPCAGLFTEAKVLELLGLQMEQFIESHRHAGPARAMDRADRAGLRRVLEMLGANLHDQPSLLDMAREAGMSHGKLNICFKQAYGVTVFEWLRQARLDRARELLGAGCSIAEAALLAGFCDQSHLNRCFKRRFGLTPGQYLRARRG